MPEADTVWRTAHRLHQVFAGHRLIGCDLRWPSIAEIDFRGADTIEVVSHGKHILHRLRTAPDAAGRDRWTIHSHLRMDGSWRIERTEQPPRAHPHHRIRAVLATGQYTAVGHDLGMLDVVATEDEQTLVGHLGPDILGANWDPDRAVSNLQAAPVHLGAALLDQRNLAGIGTIWAAETLFVQRLDPWTLTTELTAEQLLAVVNRAHRLITAACAHPMPSSTGELRAGRNTYAHGRERRPCRRCGQPIQKRPIGPLGQQRPMFFCAQCQGV